jgi:hypothetical protein
MRRDPACRQVCCRLPGAACGSHPKCEKTDMYQRGAAPTSLLTTVFFYLDGHYRTLLQTILRISPPMCLFCVIVFAMVESNPSYRAQDQ